MKSISCLGENGLRSTSLILVISAKHSESSSTAPVINKTRSFGSLLRILAAKVSPSIDPGMTISANTNRRWHRLAQSRSTLDHRLGQSGHRSWLVREFVGCNARSVRRRQLPELSVQVSWLASVPKVSSILRLSKNR